MKRPCDYAIDVLRFVAPVLLMVLAITPALAQQDQRPNGIVDDWTHHHVIFSNPGAMEDAIRNGDYEKWHQIVTDPRYRMQWIKRYPASAVQMTADSYRFPGLRHRPPDPGPPRHEPRGPVLEDDNDTIHGDWAVTLAGGAGTGPAPGMYPAKFSFSTTATPDCTNDFVVFPITPSPIGQANLIGVNNLYSGTCTGTVPNFLFAYDFGGGGVQTSPVLSEDGTKVALVESITGNGSTVGSIFHVLTLDKRGSSGCPNSPCNGTAFNSPAVPCTVNGAVSCSTNSAVDTKITMRGGVSVSRSSPFVDYTNDIAYVGDDNGDIHKFTGVFNGTPTEVITGGWPYTAGQSAATSPIYDSVSGNLFFGTANGNIRCVIASSATDCGQGAVSVANGTGTASAVIDAPIVDSTNKTVFVTASNTSNGSILFQANTTLATASQVRVAMGASGTDLYVGAFDNAYFTSASTGHMYFCGNVSSTAATPTLYRVGFSSTGIMNNTKDSGSFQLVLSGNTGAGVDCTPLTEVFNSSQSKDYLFLGVKSHGFMTGTPNCANQTCVMSFSLPTALPFTFPSSANAATTSNLGSKGISGIIIDNVSGSTGTSQIYFGNLQVNTGVQASQSALQ